MRNIFKLAKTNDIELRQQERQLMPSVMVEQTSAVLLGIINMMVMGTVSSAALAGVGQVNSVNNMIVYFFNSFAMGGTVMVAQNIGAKNPDAARKSAYQAIYLGLFMSLAITALLFVFRVEFLQMLFGKADADVMEYSMQYFKASLPSTPFWFIVFQCSGVMRGSGDTKTPMRISLIMNVINIICSVLFVMVFKLEALGAGYAMVISVATGAILSIYTMLRRDYRLCIRDYITLKPDFAEMKLLSSVGFPAALENLMFNGGKVIVQVFLAGMGTVMISAYQVANSAVSLLQIPMSTINVLIVTLVGQRAGSGDKEKTAHALNYVYAKGVVWSLFLAVACVILAWPTCWLFSRDPNVLFAGTMLVMIYAIFTPLWSPAFIVPSGFRGARDVTYTLIVATISMWSLRVYGSYLLGVVFGWSAYGVYLAMCLDWVGRTFAYLHRLNSGKWLHKVGAKTTAN